MVCRAPARCAPAEKSCLPSARWATSSRKSLRGQRRFTRSGSVPASSWCPRALASSPTRLTSWSTCWPARSSATGTLGTGSPAPPGTPVQAHMAGHGRLRAAVLRPRLPHGPGGAGAALQLRVPPVLLRTGRAEPAPRGGARVPLRGGCPATAEPQGRCPGVPQAPACSAHSTLPPAAVGCWGLNCFSGGRVGGHRPNKPLNLSKRPSRSGKRSARKSLLLTCCVWDLESPGLWSLPCLWTCKKCLLHCSAVLLAGETFPRGVPAAATVRLPSFSLTSVPGNVTEQIILSATTQHNQGIGPSQDGFIKGRSCLTNLISFSKQVTCLGMRERLCMISSTWTSVKPLTPFPTAFSWRNWQPMA
ncbi:uncharacterized protein LOC116439341 [Corvus moneduloides]|uniref:uncharacterized protein LOC116439341 n=1 Tax=Corvus moneduloides TaxID=1196302 RepID=UPI0013647167|nr:uncharacterized protein LOC116439341 [Corvus moneduloides]